MRKKAIIMLVALMSLGWPAHAFAVSTEQTDEVIALEYPLVEAYNNILDGFEKENGKIKYPDDYAGAYIEDCVLHICLTELSPEREEYYKELCGQIDPEFEVKSYSRDQLQEIRDVIEEKNIDDIVSIGLSEKDNEIIVGVLNDCKDVRDEIYNALPQVMEVEKKNEVPINIVEKEPMITDVALKGGMQLTNKNGSRFTLGISGTYRGDDALLTCGHAFKTKGEEVYYNGNLIGTVTKLKYGNSDYYDYAVVKITESGFSTTNKLASGTVIKSINKLPVEGMTVKKYGAKTGITQGIVTAVDIAFEDEHGNVTYGLMEASFSTEKGDSGGPVYASSNMYGTVTGHIGSHSYFSPSGAVSGFDI